MKNKKIGRGSTEEKTVDKKTTVKKGIKPELFNKEPAYINFKLGATLNMGNYSSKKIEIGITKPCKNTKKQIDKTFIEIIKDVENRISKEIDKVQPEDQIKEHTDDLEFI
jgi:hypothetical protein